MQEPKTEKIIGNTRFIVTAEYSAKATETVEQKLLRIMSRHILELEKLSESYQDNAETACYVAPNS
jgi:hypothetical protein